MGLACVTAASPRKKNVFFRGEAAVTQANMGLYAGLMQVLFGYGAPRLGLR